ncbi:MAG: glycosyl transferase [Candidatus Brocadia sp. WS118]|nr:MAG: glycosyl transferase [Candidatus Brocadia sp. WS118]
MRIAILILIHKYTQQQIRLINNLATDFDIYVHIDKRTIIIEKDICSNNVYAFKKYNVYWGSFNQIQATIMLLKEANKKHYDRYIIISGEDIPIKTNSEIKDFFCNNTKEYFEYSQLPRSVWGGNGGFDRIDYYYLNSLNRGISNRVKRKVYKILEGINAQVIIPFMKKNGICRRMNIKYFGGTNWMNLTDNCTNQILDYIKNNKQYVNSFKHTRCADEIFFQTIICNYTHGIELENNSLRYVDWKKGPETPRILRMEDYEELEKSICLFARKFNQEVDNDIITRMFSKINYV